MKIECVKNFDLERSNIAKKIGKNVDVICLRGRKKRDIEQRMKMLSKLSNGGIAFQSVSQLHCISCSDTTNTKHNGEEKKK